MKSLILYGCNRKLTNAHKPVTVDHGTPNGASKSPPYFVRSELFNGDVDSALQKAKPMDGENVLNTVEV